MNYYKLQKPYSLHCDNLGPGKGFYQIVLPLSFSPENTAPHTIIFDQTSETYTEWIAPIYEKPKDYKPFRNKPILDPNYYGGWSDEFKIPEEMGQLYWGSRWDGFYREAYKGFSIRHAYQWKPGEAFVFDSKFNHCASQLEQDIRQEKIGLLVCLERS